MKSSEGPSDLSCTGRLFRCSPAVVLAFHLLASAVAWAQPNPRLLRVPGDFPTIQAALDNASALVVDTVLVDPGTYHESIQLVNKDVRILGAGGASTCYLVAPAGSAAVRLAGAGPNAVLSGFTITNSTTAISIEPFGGATIISNTIINCGSGIYCSFSSPIIRSNRFLSCSGPAISLAGVAAAVVEGNLIQGNNGAIRMNSAGTPIIRNNIIRDTIGDAVGALNQSQATISQNVILNSTGSGIVTALYCAAGELLIVNNTIFGNAAGITTAGYGGCVRIINNIVVGVRAVDGDATPPFLQNNNIFSRTGGAYHGTIPDQTGTNGNISLDPYFACEPSEEFHLLPGSPCIDAGASKGVTLPSADFDGHPRIVPGRTGGSAAVDMGTFEFDPSHAPDPCLFLYCPSNMLVMVPPGQDSAVVHYPAPFATPVATVTTSPASGSLFPEADNRVGVSAVYGTNVLNCSFTISLFTSTNFGRAFNLTNMAWVTSGDASWFVQNAITHTGPVAAQSGAITNNQTSTLQTTFTGPGALTFWWKVSSEADHDLLFVTVNGSTQAVISGQVDWQQRTVYLGPGMQVVQWKYAKDANGSAGQDAGWLDQVTLTPGFFPPLITIQPASVSPGPGMNAVFAVTAAGTPPLSYQWLFNGSALPGATGPSLVITNVQAPNAGIYSVLVMNQVGTNHSSNATLGLARVLAWGANSYGQTNVPVDLTNVAAIAGGSHHSVALKTDGTVTVWGANNRHQINVPPGLSNVVAIASHTGDQCMALRGDGTVVVWGDNSFGMTNVPAGLSNVVAVAAGGYHCLALKSDGTAVSWGDIKIVAGGLSNIVAVSAGDFANLFLRGDGSVAATGTTVPANVTNITAIAAGGLHNLALKADGTVIAWGNNSYGQSSVPTGLVHVVAIAAGRYHSAALGSDGTVVVWGRYYTGTGFVVPVVPAGLTNVVAIAAGADHDLALLGNTSPPFITTEPVSQTVVAGSTATFSVTASPIEARLSYNWRFNGTNDIPYATNSSLTLSNVQSASAGLYSVRITNLFGSVISSNALLQVDHPPLADASATRSPVISANGVNATVVLDGSRSSDPDGDPLQYAWLSTLSSQSSTRLASGIVAVVGLPVGVYSITLVVSDGLAASTNSVSVAVLTTTQAVEQLTSLVKESGLDHSRRLAAILEAALASLERGNSTAAANKLLAFRNMLMAQVAPSDPAMARTLIAAAQNVADALQVGGSRTRATKLEAVKDQRDGKVQVRFSSGAGRTHIVEGSINLADWEIIGVAREQGEGTFEFEDASAATFTNRFYRVSSP